MLINSSLSDYTFIAEHISLFHRIGFRMEKFGPNIFKVTHVPLVLSESDMNKVFDEFIVELKQKNKIDNITSTTSLMLATLACKSAIKSGYALSAEERKKLIKELKDRDYIYTCPHGRPVKMELSLDALHKLFKRK